MQRDDILEPKSIYLLNCPHCSYVTKWFGKFVSHLITNHDVASHVDLFSCPTCKLKSTHSSLLKDHMECEHGKQDEYIVTSLASFDVNRPDESTLFECVFCGEKADDKKEIQQHYTDFHNSSPTSRKLVDTATNTTPISTNTVGVSPAKTIENVFSVKSTNLPAFPLPIKIKEEPACHSPPVDLDICITSVSLPKKQRFESNTLISTPVSAIKRSNSSFDSIDLCNGATYSTTTTSQQNNVIMTTIAPQSSSLPFTLQQPRALSSSSSLQQPSSSHPGALSLSSTLQQPSQPGALSQPSTLQQPSSQPSTLQQPSSQPSTLQQPLALSPSSVLQQSSRDPTDTGTLSDSPYQIPNTSETLRAIIESNKINISSVPQTIIHCMIKRVHSEIEVVARKKKIEYLTIESMTMIVEHFLEICAQSGLFFYKQNNKIMFRQENTQYFSVAPGTFALEFAQLWQRFDFVVTPTTLMNNVPAVNPSEIQSTNIQHFVQQVYGTPQSSQAMVPVCRSQISPGLQSLHQPPIQPTVASNHNTGSNVLHSLLNSSSTLNVPYQNHVVPNQQAFVQPPLQHALPSTNHNIVTNAHNQQMNAFYAQVPPYIMPSLYKTPLIDQHNAINTQMSNLNQTVTSQSQLTCNSTSTQQNVFNAGYCLMQPMYNTPLQNLCEMNPTDRVEVNRTTSDQHMTNTINTPQQSRNNKRKSNSSTTINTPHQTSNNIPSTTVNKSNTNVSNISAPQYSSTSNSNVHYTTSSRKNKPNDSSINNLKSTVTSANCNNENRSLTNFLTDGTNFLSLTTHSVHPIINQSNKNGLSTTTAINNEPSLSHLPRQAINNEPSLSHLPRQAVNNEPSLSHPSIPAVSNPPKNVADKPHFTTSEDEISKFRNRLDDILNCVIGPTASSVEHNKSTHEPHNKTTVTGPTVSSVEYNKSTHEPHNKTTVIRKTNISANNTEQNNIENVSPPPVVTLETDPGPSNNDDSSSDLIITSVKSLSPEHASNIFDAFKGLASISPPKVQKVEQTKPKVNVQDKHKKVKFVPTSFTNRSVMHHCPQCSRYFAQIPQLRDHLWRCHRKTFNGTPTTSNEKHKQLNKTPKVKSVPVNTSANALVFNQCAECKTVLHNTVSFVQHMNAFHGASVAADILQRPSVSLRRLPGSVHYRSSPMSESDAPACPLCPTPIWETWHDFIQHAKYRHDMGPDQLLQLSV